MSTEAMRNVEPRLAGAASGIDNTIRQVGSVIGAATVGALPQGRLAAELATGKTYADAFIATMHVTAILPITVVLAGALACLLVRNHTRAEPADPVPATATRETTPGR
ncbi:hypothetical protein [Kitasatospora sp. NPDC088548]|uniref:hypothetical protein n=1 Tax=Kitasatospora sp. NPDC088548 TaxID=3364075 RepID=UPI0037FF3542